MKNDVFLYGPVINLWMVGCEKKTFLLFHMQSALKNFFVVCWERLKKVFVPFAETVWKIFLSSGIDLATAVDLDVLADKSFTQLITSCSKAQAVNFRKDPLWTVLGSTLGRRLLLRPARKTS